MRGTIPILAVALLAACDNRGSTPDWSRMITQPKLMPYGATDLFADGRAMRTPPDGVVARGRIASDEVRTGRGSAGADATTIPLTITRALLDRGRDRFTIACAVCHGVAGDGDSAVARSMQRRRPPSLFEPRIAALSPGAMYRVVTEGYGLMPAYAAMLTVDDRWAVVAYVRTLELAAAAPVAALPSNVAAAARRSLP